MSVARLDSARLSVVLDIRQPQAYLALHPVAQMAREAGVEINWLPIVVSPLKPPTTPTPEDGRGVRHRRFRAQAIAREIETYADVQGLAIRDYYRGADPSAFNLAWLWVREVHPDRLFPFLSEAFRAYWNLELDPSSDRAMRRSVDELGLDAAAFVSWRRAAGEAAGESLEVELRESGLARAPGYVVDGETFVGRQHLPMIRWILAGRSGRGPI